jgi:hypothetical protein
VIQVGRLTSGWSGPAEVTSHFFRAFRPPAAQPQAVRQRGGRHGHTFESMNTFDETRTLTYILNAASITLLIGLGGVYAVLFKGVLSARRDFDTFMTYPFTTRLRVLLPLDHAWRCQVRHEDEAALTNVRTRVFRIQLTLLLTAVLSAGLIRLYAAILLAV